MNYKHTQAEKYKREEIEQLEEHDDWQTNMDMLKIEENQFQEYTQQVISEANERKAPIYPIQAASKSGAGNYIQTIRNISRSIIIFLCIGGGRGNVFSGKGGVRPSYQTTDSHGIELPSYAIDSSKLPLSWRIKNTKKRMGFTWQTYMYNNELKDEQIKLFLLIEIIVINKQLINFNRPPSARS